MKEYLATRDFLEYRDTTTVITWIDSRYTLYSQEGQG
jgi:hypothetical protein